MNPARRHRPSRRPIPPARPRATACALALLGAMSAAAQAQTTFQETFTGTTAHGWLFGGLNSVTPFLTAATGANGSGGGAPIDSDGDGWLRLTENEANQSTYALLDTEIFSTNAQIQIEMEYAFWNGTGADGITFFLVDGSVNAETFVPGAYGGSMGYAQKNQAATNIPGGVPGMPGGYLGIALDNWGNYSNNNEGRIGGVEGPGASPVDDTLRPNRVVVRGPESSGYAFIDASDALPQSMDFPDYTTRPTDVANTITAAANYRSFRLTLDAGNYLVVEMKFGADSEYIVAFEADLSDFTRPDSFKVGFTGATGGANEIHEIRSLSVVSTPYATLGGSFEWDDGNGANDDWGTLAGGEGNTNWFGVGGNNNKTPLRDSDVFFGNRPSATTAGTAARPSPYASPQTVNLNNNVEVRSLNFNTKYDYTLGGSGTITLGDTTQTGTPSINVNDPVLNPRFHKINNALTVIENLLVANQSASTLCLNGPLNLGANTLTTMGQGYTNFNGAITGSGPLVVNGAPPNGRDSTGIVTLKGNNAATYTGAITVNGGQLVALHNGALGNTGSATTVTPGGTLTFRGGITTSEPLVLAGSGTFLSDSLRAGAVYNDGGDNTLNGAVTLAGDTVLHSRAGNLTLAGAIGQSGGSRALVKTGDGVVTLNANNTYTGETRVQGGALRVGAADRINGSDLVLNGGVLELSGDLDTGHAAHFTRSVGTTGGDDVRWTGDGGFSASGGDRTVNLGAGASLAWGSGGFVGTGKALLLSSAHADSTVTLANAINLGAASREVRVAQGSAAVDGILSGALTGTGGLVKTGDGTLQLTGANTYSGATEIRGGALRSDTYGGVSTNSNYVLNGGVLETNVALPVTLGTGAGQLQWTGSGGFSAFGADVTHSLNSGAALTWNSGNFVGTGHSLVFGSSSATHAATLSNNISLGGAIRTVEVRDGASAATEGRLSGVLSSSNSSGGLNVVGTGRLELSGNNTYTGATTVNGAELRITGAAGDIAQSGGVTINGGGTLILDNTTAGNGNRVGTVTVNMNAGSLGLLGQTGNIDSTETVGTINLQSGANSLSVGRGSSNGSAQLAIGGFTRSAGATVDFTASAGTLGGSGDDGSRITGSSNGAIANTDGILGGWATAGDNWATEISNGQGIGALATYEVSTDHNQWDTTENISVSTAIGMTGTGVETVNSLRFTGAGGSISVNDRAHRVASGGVLVANGATATIHADNGTGSFYATGSSELFVHTQGNGSLTIQGRITNDGSNVKALTKSGTGTLTLSGAQSNTYTGTTTVNAGTLQLGKTGGATAIAGNLVVGDTSGVDTVKLLGSEQIADNRDVTLRGGTLLNNNHQAVLDLNGFTETFDTLTITGNSVVDFSGGDPCTPSFLVIDALSIAADGLLTIRNWIDATDYFLISRTGLDSLAEQANIGRVIFEGYGAAAWEAYSSDYFMLTPHTAPVPEPATYGLLAVGGLVGFAATRRRRRA